MSFTERISVIIDVTADKATRGMKDFKSSVKEAEGFTGKLKAGVGSLGSAFTSAAKSPAGLTAAASAAAVGIAAVVDKAADLGVQVGKFSDATGLAFEDSSRWIEVAGDIGVEAGSVETALNKLNRSIDPEKFKELGIEIAKTTDGATDVNATFLNVIDRLNSIKDPAERATVATKLLGKGWQDMAEIIGLGSKEIRDRLAEVSDAKVFDRKDVDQARAFRAMLDDLAGVGEDVALAIGKDLIPMVVGLGKVAIVAADGVGLLGQTLKGLAGDSGPVSASAMKDLQRQAAELGDAFYDSAFAVENNVDSNEDLFAALRLGTVSVEDLQAALDAARTSVDTFTPSVNKGRGALNEWNPAAKKAQENTDALAESTRKAEAATRDYKSAYDELIGKLDEEEAWEGVIEKVFAVADGVDDSKQEFRDAKRELIAYVDEFADIPESVKTSLITKLDQGAVNEVTAYLNGLRMGVTVPVKPVGSGGSTLGGGGKRASGGQVRAGVPYTVGEQGTEMFVPSTNGVVVPHGMTQQLMQGGGGAGRGTPMVVNINTGADPREVIEVIKRYTRSGGQL